MLWQNIFMDGGGNRCCLFRMCNKMGCISNCPENTEWIHESNQTNFSSFKDLCKQIHLTSMIFELASQFHVVFKCPLCIASYEILNCDKKKVLLGAFSGPCETSLCRVVTEVRGHLGRRCGDWTWLGTIVGESESL